jgi:hypothetical protein
MGMHNEHLENSCNALAAAVWGDRPCSCGSVKRPLDSRASDAMGKLILPKNI